MWLETVSYTHLDVYKRQALREAATKALRENRIYAPGGDNAMEYYLALRDKLPNDPGVSLSLIHI